MNSEWTSFTCTSFSIFIRRTVTKQELVNGYETEINYQRHMLENLVVGSAYSLSLLLQGIDLSSFTKASHS